MFTKVEGSFYNDTIAMTLLQKHLVFIPLFLVAAVAVLGGCIMWLWNWLMPTIFGLPTLTIWQAMGLLLLCRLLFGNIGFGGGHHHAHHSHGDCHGNQNKLRERWANMTAEERQQLIDKHICDASEQPAADGR